MGLGHKRSDLQALAQAKLDDAIILLQNNRFSNAYYLAGYAVECGLKACIAHQFAAEEIPDKSFVQKIYQHDFKSLVGLAGLTAEFQEEQDKNPDFAAAFGIAATWSPDSRYETTDAMSAQQIIQAVSDANYGVLRWIKNYW